MFVLYNNANVGKKSEKTHILVKQKLKRPEWLPYLSRIVLH